MRQQPRGILVEIQDDGKGFDAEQARGMGLLGIEERVSHLGGSFALETQPGHGSRVSVRLPAAEVPEHSLPARPSA